MNLLAIWDHLGHGQGPEVEWELGESQVQQGGQAGWCQASKETIGR